MKYRFTKVLILKPQANLLVLINDHLPNFNWKSVALKKQNLTAYVLPDFKDEGDMLTSLESFYLKIFRNELAKIIGFKNSLKLKVSFFDFLSCFKFELNDSFKIVSIGFLKRIGIRQKIFKINPRLDNIQTLEDFINAYAEEILNEKILYIKDLNAFRTTQRLLLKIRCIFNNIERPLKHNFNWHWLSHARDPGFF